MKIAVFTTMLPQKLQEIVYTQTGDNDTYEQVRDKVQAIVNNQVAINSGPMPMDLGNAASKDKL